MREDTRHFVVGGLEEGVIVSFSTHDSVGTTPPADSGGSPSRPWYPFGTNNLLPDELNRLIWDNSTKPELIKKVAAFMVGKGFHPYIPRIVNNEIVPELVTDSRWTEFEKRHQLPKKMMSAAKNLATFNNVAVEVVLNGTKNAIHTIKIHDFNKVRAEIIGRSGRIEAYYLCGNWKSPKYAVGNEEEGNVFRVPAWDPDNPWQHGKFIVHLKDATVGNDYYGFPSWYGTRNWLQLSNQIPLWHLAGMKNGYNVRWHIQIPESYFDRYQDDAEKERAKSALQQSMGDWLAGVENVGKSLVSFFQADETGKKVDGWQISPITFDLQDEAFTKLFEQSEASVAAGGGMDPVLAGVQFPGKMGAGSGSEKRLSYQIHILLNTTLDRQVLTEMLEAFEKIERWPPEWRYAFQDYDLTTLDQLKSGMQPVITTQ